MTLHLFKETEVRLPRRRLMELFNRIIKAESNPKAAGQINVVFTTDRALRDLNKRFRGKDSVTDVLSFHIDDAPAEDEPFGEIYIAVPAARRQAPEYGETFAGELLRLTCHGLLHLFGYDHENESDAAKMRAREERYLGVVRGRRL